MVGLMKPIRLERRLNSQDATGRWIAGTITKYNVWAEVSKVGASRNPGNQTQLTGQVTFKMWFNNGLNLTTDWKVVYAGKRYTITGIDVLNEMRFNYLINATEISGGDSRTW